MLPEPGVLDDGVVRLRPFGEPDVRAVQSACNDDEVQRWLPLPRPYTEDHARAWCTRLGAELRESGRGMVLAVEARGALAGSLDVKSLRWGERCAERGYWTVPEHRGRGLTTRAVVLVTRWLLLDVRLERAELRIAVENEASRRVAQRAGFVAEGVLRRAGYTPTGQIDLVMYSTVRADLTGEDDVAALTTAHG